MIESYMKPNVDYYTANFFTYIKLFTNYSHTHFFPCPASVISSKPNLLNTITYLINFSIETQDSKGIHNKYTKQKLKSNQKVTEIINTINRNYTR